MSKNNAAYGLPLNALSVVVVEPSKAMQNIMRSVLTLIKVSRVRVFENSNDAIRAMYSERPHLILTDLAGEATGGTDLINLIRRPDMVPLCYVPVIVVTADTSHSSILQALEAGAHYVMSKPVSPSKVEKVIRWVSSDTRPIALNNARFEISGIEELVANFKRSTGAGGAGGSEGLKFSIPGSNSAAGDAGLKFHRENSNEALEQRLRFAKENGAQPDRMSGAPAPDNDAGSEPILDEEAIEARRARAASGFAPLSR